MTTPTDTYQTYQSIGNAEDVDDLIYNIDPTETPLMSMIAGKGKAAAVYHEWQTQALAAVNASNQHIEGDVYTRVAATPTVRVGNRCQIFKIPFGVSGTQEAIRKYGRKSEIAYQTALKGKELKRDIESRLCSNNASVTGNASTARQLGGLESWFTSNVSRGSGGSNGGFTSSNTVAATDGTQRAFTEALLKSALKSAWDNGGQPDTALMGSFNKQAFSSFAGNATRFKEAEDRKLVASISVYESDFGKIKAVPSRFCRSRTVSLLQSDMVSVDYLRPIKVEPLAKIADSEDFEYVAELTLKVHNQAAHAVVADLTTS